MKKPHEMIPGDKIVRLNFYLVAALYFLILVFLEPIIDFVLMLGVNNSDPQSIINMNQNKVLVSNMAVTVMQVIPMLFIAWFGYRILASARLPPARMKLPFTVPLIKGKNARMIGLLLITLALFLISQDLVTLGQAIR
jgi:hypothetical protein